MRWVMVLMLCAACSSGTQSPPGSQGERGPEGPAGPQGERGPEGPAGPQGERGETGPTGSVGPSGSPGLQGERGPVGPAGLKGDRGDTGPAGGLGSRHLVWVDATGAVLGHDLNAACVDAAGYRWYTNVPSTGLVQCTPMAYSDMYYTTQDCTGPGYLEREDPRVVIQRYDTGQFYTRGDAQEFQSITVRSVRSHNAGGICVEQNYTDLLQAAGQPLPIIPPVLSFKVPLHHELR